MKHDNHALECVEDRRVPSFLCCLENLAISPFPHQPKLVKVIIHLRGLQRRLELAGHHGQHAPTSTTPPHPFPGASARREQARLEKVKGDRDTVRECVSQNLDLSKCGGGWAASARSGS
eukprot:m.46579 g.46579  ORF g.46579 m.46579 type:complete len:119 (-) comp8780_c0_seq1:2318-2674(-)